MYLDQTSLRMGFSQLQITGAWKEHEEKCAGLQVVRADGLMDLLVSEAENLWVLIPEANPWAAFQDT